MSKIRNSRERALEWGSANRPKFSNKLSIPNETEGNDGDIQLRQTNLGGKLFGKLGGKWLDVPFSVDGITKIGTNLSNYLSIDRDSIDIYKNDIKVATFGETTTVKDINLTGKIVVTSTGTQNVVMGTGNADAGEDNIVLGVNAGTNLGSGSVRNTFIGTLAGNDMVSGDENIYIGYQAGHVSDAGSYNVSIGALSTPAMTTSGASTGSLNTVLGTNAGKVLVNGNGNTYIGALITAGGTSVENEVVLSGYDRVTFATGQGTNTVTLGNNACTDIYCSQDAGATVRCGKIISELATANEFIITSTSNTVGDAAALHLQRAHTTSVVDDDGDIGEIVFKSWDGDTEYLASAMIRCVANGTHSNDSVPADLQFWTRDTATSGGHKQRMIIDRDGKVGIGTNNPLTNLHVEGASGEGIITISNLDDDIQNGDSLGTIQFQSNDESANPPTNSIVAKIEAKGYAATNGQHPADIVFSTTHLNTLTERMVIHRDGNVGIGIADPLAKFHVYGSGGQTFYNENTALSNTQRCEFLAVAKKDNNDGGVTATNNYGGVGVVYNASPSNGTDQAVGYLRLDSSDLANNYIWMDDDGDLRVAAGGGFSDCGTQGGNTFDQTSSDERIKDIDSNPFPYGLAEINKLVPIKYKFNNTKNPIDKLGFGAQTTNSIIPESVFITGQCIDGYTPKMVDKKDSNGNIIKEKESIPNSDDRTKMVMEYKQIIPVLVKAVQELSTKMDTMQTEINNLK